MKKVRLQNRSQLLKGMARFQQATALMAVDNLIVKPVDDALVKCVAQGKMTERKAIALLKQRYAVNKFKVRLVARRHEV